MKSGSEKQPQADSVLSSSDPVPMDAYSNPFCKWGFNVSWGDAVNNDNAKAEQEGYWDYNKSFGKNDRDH